MASPNFNLEPILLKKPIANIDEGAVMKALRDFALNAKSDLSNYPSQKSSKYKRTGRLGRSWTQNGPKKSGADIVVEVGTNVEYAGYVEGFRKRAVPKQFKQTRYAAAAGWPSIEDVLDKRWGTARLAILKALS